MHGLEASMMQQLKEIVNTKNRFGVGFASSEAWDVMQTKVFTDCSPCYRVNWQKFHKETYK